MIDSSTHRRAARLDRIAGLLDDRYSIPGTKVRFGWDSIIGLVPVVGDTATSVIAAYIVIEAHRLGVPRWMIARMAGNVAIDLATGAVPIVGDLLDLGFKANRRNIRMLQRHLERAERTRGSGPSRGRTRDPRPA